MSGLSILPPSLFVLLVLAAALSDLLWRKIPNWTVVALVVLYFILVVMGLAPTNPWSGLAAAAISLTVTYVLYYFRVFGAGDAKLFSAVALFAGLSHLLPFALVTTFLGGALAIGYMIVNPKRVLRGLTAQGRAFGVSQGVPYGISIAGAAVLVALISGFLQGSQVQPGDIAAFAAE